VSDEESKKSRIGRPSRNVKKGPQLDDLIVSDPSFRRDMIDKTKVAFEAAYEYLLSVVSGSAKAERRVSNKGEVVDVDLTHDIRVKAAKVLKEITLDKFVADKKDAGTEKGKREGMSLREALMEIEKQRRQEAETKAKEAGKLKNISELKGK